MLDKPLDFGEQELLALIRQIHATSGPIPRNQLTVAGRGRGLEVARPLGRLKMLGLVEEYEQRPSWWRRLFGAASVMVLVPGAAAGPDLPAGTEILSEAEAPMHGAEADAVAEALQAEFIAAPESEIRQAAAPLETIGIPAPPEQPEPAPADPHPVAPQQAAAPARPRQRFAPVPPGYTDELGGAPLAYQPAATTALSPELLEGLCELLGTLGMEMTMAGETLVADRLARGATPGEALMQLVLFAFGHAARFEMASGNPARPEDLQEYGTAVLAEMTRLYAAGEIGAAQFEHDRQGILALSDSSQDRSQLVAELFMDPIGGAAPPALLPEELRSIEEDEEEAGL
ncbi:hypothetical protein [Pseudogemmobacter faecipullorum]|uniref:Uncharacterized protein n=1 Tax=Pseudogemmobacter faecipullorum TaxID=2755041 RepID=A0ABS8CN74_9RHOB|nr:hypothetical protein [Pseudogemmobacter faecipullorum]MCB5410839.1 hypothetical protein [Pseudogemmobacter faecipullorum]